MGETMDVGALLPGTWRIAATNVPVWLDGSRLEPTFTFELVDTDPLVLADDLAFRTPDHEEKHILGRNVWRGDAFHARRGGILRLARGRWTVSGASADGTIAAIRVDASTVRAAGVDILVRSEVERPELRTLIARDTVRYGLTLEEFASLSWTTPTAA